MHPEDLKAEFRKRNLSVKSAAKMIGFSRQAVSDTVNGRKPSLQIQEAIAQLLGMPVKKLFPRKKRSSTREPPTPHKSKVKSQVQTLKVVPESSVSTTHEVDHEASEGSL